MIVLNGDIIDIWQFKKSYFPKQHMQVIRKLLKFAKDIPVYYITGNHDEALRRYSGHQFGNLHLVDKLVLEVDNKKYWFFHGDIFDTTMKCAKWLAKLGAIGYDTLIMTNSIVNWILERLGRERMSFSKKIKNSVKKAVSYISEFEQTAADIAIDQGYDYVVCGHIHQPEMREIKGNKGSVMYLNSGDWIENLSALEYVNGKWSMYRFGEAILEHYQEQENEVPELELMLSSLVS
jgi:UDP-2,3-diacylglucosamine pyrophosphatase LpxH